MRFFCHVTHWASHLCALLPVKFLFVFLLLLQTILYHTQTDSFEKFSLIWHRISKNSLCFSTYYCYLIISINRLMSDVLMKRKQKWSFRVILIMKINLFGHEIFCIYDRLFYVTALFLFKICNIIWKIGLWTMSSKQIYIWIMKYKCFWSLWYLYISIKNVMVTFYSDLLV
jgi:hypothetical protein